MNRLMRSMLTIMLAAAAPFASLAHAAEGVSAAEIEAATEALAKGTEAFAALRMNQGIRQALSGKKLEEV